MADSDKDKDKDKGQGQQSQAQAGQGGAQQAPGQAAAMAAEAKQAEAGNKVEGRSDPMDPHASPGGSGSTPYRTSLQRAERDEQEENPLAQLARILGQMEERTKSSGPAFATPGMSETIPGGKYIVKGKLVNAHNREIDQDGNILHPEQLQQDPFSGRAV